MIFKLLTLYCALHCVFARSDIKIPTFPRCCRKPPCPFGERYTCLWGVGRQKIACVPNDMSKKGMKYLWMELCYRKLRCKMVDDDYVCRCFKHFTKDTNW
uniref:Basic tail secreted protein n=1 Tax=Rhipicephalus zambeziensis TaxID=60191 RepID=A0A224Y9D1_9ACAR